MVLLIIVIYLGCISHLILGHDNIIEETSEEIILIETGKDVDVTPESREKGWNLPSHYVDSPSSLE
jgi:hypothetical protein